MNNGTRTFSFKPALLSIKQTYFITSGQIEKSNKNGNDTIVHFEDITGLRYADTTAKEYRFRRLDITYGNQKLLRIGLTLPYTSTMRNDENLATFYNLMHSIAARLSQSRSNISINIGETVRVNWIYFAIGALTLLSSAGILLGAYLSGVSNQKMTNALFPILVMAGFGVYICFSAKPWAKRVKISITKFRSFINKSQKI